MAKEIELQNVLAGFFCSFVENKPLDEALKEVGLSEQEILSQWFASENPEFAKQYFNELMLQDFNLHSRDDNAKLYLVKKILCSPGDFGKMAQVVSDKNTDKFDIIRIIGYNQKLMGYKKEKCGIEVYLVSGKTPLEALRKTTNMAPTFHYAASTFDSDDAEKFDELFFQAIYKHTPESIERILEETRFGI